MTMDGGNQDPERGHWFVHILDRRKIKNLFLFNLFLNNQGVQNGNLFFRVLDLASASETYFLHFFFCYRPTLKIDS